MKITLYSRKLEYGHHIFLLKNTQIYLNFTSFQITHSIKLLLKFKHIPISATVLSLHNKTSVQWKHNTYDLIGTF